MENNIVNIALIDMDGTLCDYDTAMNQELEKLRSPNEPVFQHGEQLPPWMEARRTAVSTIPGFWKKLPRLNIGFEILRHLLYHKFEVHVLSKGPSSKPIAWMEKHEWCRQNMPSSVKITLTEDKALVYGKILVDDWPAYYQDWLETRPRGLVIVPAQPWNVDAESYDPRRIYRYDGSNPVKLESIISAVRNRVHGQPLYI